MLQMLCTNNAPLQNICLSLVMATVGSDYNQLNTVSNRKRYLKYAKISLQLCYLTEVIFNLINSYALDLFKVSKYSLISFPNINDFGIFL